MKESLRHKDNTVIFNATFESAAEMAQYGIGGFTTITYANGIATTTGGGYFKVPYGSRTVSIRAKVNLEIAGYIFDFRANSGTGYLTIGTSSNLLSSGTLYVNGVVSAIIPAYNQVVDIVVTGISINVKDFMHIFESYLGSSNTNGSIELFQIYNRTLSAEEVSALYKNQLYTPPRPTGGFSQYPPVQNDTYVKATSNYGAGSAAYYATDPTKDLTGIWTNKSWFTPNGTITNQRFHIDLGSSKIINKVYYHNFHSVGGSTTIGVKNFTMYGSNSASDFADLTYINDGTWTLLTTSISQFVQHTASDVSDPKDFNVTNNVSYRYYAFKFVDNWGDANNLGVRRIELQTILDSRLLHIPSSPSIFDLKGNAITNTAVTVIRDGDKDVMKFNGSTSYLQVTQNLGLQGLYKSSMSCWVNPNSNSTSQYFICNYGDASNRYGIGILLGLGYFVQANNAGSQYGSVVTITLKKWTHVTLVFDGTQVTNATRLKLYINGVLQTLTFTGTIAASLSASTMTTRLGTSVAAGEWFNGLISNPKILNTAMTSEEVSREYNSNKHLYGL